MLVIEDLKVEMIGQKCSRVDIRHDKTFFLGLGKLYPTRNKKGIVPYYGFWEFGTYNSSWRIVKSKQILLGSNDFVEDFDAKKRSIHLLGTTLLDIKDFGRYDLTFYFSDDYSIEFLKCFSYEDEILHVLRYDGIWWAKNSDGIWEKGFDKIMP